MDELAVDVRSAPPAGPATLRADNETPAEPPARPSSVRGLRLTVALAAGVATVLKLLIAANTYGTNDVRYWTQFAAGVRQYGVFGAYGHILGEEPYNHPPLSGAMLAGINWLTDHGVAHLPFLVRTPASVADLGTALVVFELLRPRTRPWVAALAGIGVAWSPVMFTISGFHGNTDPVFIFFSLLCVYLLTRPVTLLSSAGAGLAFSLAMSVKIVPVVLVPVLAVALLQRGRRHPPTFVLGSLIGFVPLWGPVVLTNWAAFRSQVIGYTGTTVDEWGVVQFARWAGATEATVQDIIGPGRFVILAISSLIPAILVWRRPEQLARAAGFALVLFLLLASAFSMQYLVWCVAAAMLVSPYVGLLYNVAASFLIISVYDHWNGDRPPWQWYEGRAVRFTDHQLHLMVVTWIALAVVALRGFGPPSLRLRRTRTEEMTA